LPRARDVLPPDLLTGAIGSRQGKRWRVNVLEALRERVQQAQTIAGTAAVAQAAQTVDAVGHVQESEANLRRAIDALIAAMPVGRTVEITPEVIAMAAAGDVAQLLTLFAEEVEPEPGELAALAELDREPADRRTVSAEDVRRELGLPGS
jgi:hypothetical protein